MEKKKGPPDLSKYMGEKKRRLVSYELGAYYYGLSVTTFKIIAKEAKANLIVKRHVIVDLDILDEYLEKQKD